MSTDLLGDEDHSVIEGGLEIVDKLHRIRTNKRDRVDLKCAYACMHAWHKFIASLWYTVQP
jgi:hypothetical protein